MDTLDRVTSELKADSDTFTGNMHLEQGRLFGDFGTVDTYEINLSGSGLDGDETLEVGQEVAMIVMGRVMSIQQIVRIDPEDPFKEREILVRRAVVKASSARVREA